jgi:hypothetical protein
MIRCSKPRTHPCMNQTRKDGAPALEGGNLTTQTKSRFLSPRPGAQTTGVGKSRVAPFGMTVCGGRLYVGAEAPTPYKKRKRIPHPPVRRAKGANGFGPVMAFGTQKARMTARS